MATAAAEEFRKALDQQRTVTIFKEPGFDEQMELHRARHCMTNAIGYLSEWNMWANRFDKVRLGCVLTPTGPEIRAAYESSKSGDGYFICGIFDAGRPSKFNPDLDEWDGGVEPTFRFHS
jgi:hypothetical protein